MSQAITPIHQWTHTGNEVLVLRFADRDGRSYKGFQHPLSLGDTVIAPDWNPQPICGGGIHGWPWGIGLGEGKQPDWEALWQVYGVQPPDIVGGVKSGQKCKFSSGTLRFIGHWHEAIRFVLQGQIAWVAHAAQYAASSSGYGAPASTSEYRAPASSSDYRAPASSSGHRAPASSSGDGAPASSSGDGAPASSSGDGAPASSSGDGAPASALGNCAAAVATGCGSQVRCGKWGCLALAWRNKQTGQYEMRCAETGCGDGSDGKLKAGIWYTLDADGKFIEVNGEER